MKINEITTESLISETHEQCPECGGPMFSEMIMNEKKDACYYKVKSRYKVWPSAYASGALVKCRKAGSKNWGNKSESVDENVSGDHSLHDWFTKSKSSDGTAGWVQIGGKYAGKPCAKQPGQTTKPKCGSSKMKRSLSDKEEEAAARKKRREDPNPNRSGKAHNVATKTSEGEFDEAANRAQQAAIAIAMKKKGKKPMRENDEYDDEAGMADNNLETLRRAVEGLDEIIQPGDNLPEWCQEKIAVAKSMLVAVWDYMKSEEDTESMAESQFDMIEEMVEHLAEKYGIDSEQLWEKFDNVRDEDLLTESAAWQRKAGKNKKGGLNAKGVASYRREHPGSKLQTAVTAKPSKLKPGSKAAKRRKSFCARMSGMKGPMKDEHGKPTRKALSLRKWNC